MGLYRCAVCGSSRVTPETKQEGYNKKRGTIGMALFGLGGAVAGAGGNTVVYYHCLDCGHTLNKCMSEFEKNNIDRYLLDPDNEANKIMLRIEKKQYPNIEWEETIKAAENNADRYTKPEEPVYVEEEHKKALEELRGKIEQSHKKEIEPEVLPTAKAILNILYESGSPCTIGEIQNSNEACKEYSYSQLNNIVKCLIEKKIVEKFEKNYKSYYKTIPSTQEEAIKILEGKEVNVESAKETAFTEIEIHAFIIELLCDGKKRTLSEMKEDSDKLANVDSVKLATATMKMVKQGIIEKSEFEKKAYFTLADRA
jgi:hypothetical protein